jgi:DNA-3-methyladenine glycosylase I
VAAWHWRAAILGQFPNLVKMMLRCSWCGDDPLYVRYHDTEWGVPTHDRNALYELLMLESLQAGLSWITVLRKRRHLRAALFGLCPELVARMGKPDIARLMADPGVIRHRGKLESLATNAQCFLSLDRDGEVVARLWSYVGGAPIVNRWRDSKTVPAVDEAATAMSKMLRKAGFRFVGPTICYAFMQAAGMVNDHLVSCFRHRACQAPEARRALVVRA